MEPEVPSFLPPKKNFNTERESYNKAPPTRQLKPSTASRGPVIYLTNLDFSVTEQDIMKFLQDYNPVRAKLLKDANGRSKGTGFVEV
jgi:RNA recognition motif-containing protein